MLHHLEPHWSFSAEVRCDVAVVLLSDRLGVPLNLSKLFLKAFSGSFFNLSRKRVVLLHHPVTEVEPPLHVLVVPRSESRVVS